MRLVTNVELGADGRQHGFVALPGRAGTLDRPRLPLTVLRRGDGPRFVLIGGADGERSGSLALHRLARELEPADVSGTVVIVPEAPRDTLGWLAVELTRVPEAAREPVTLLELAGAPPGFGFSPMAALALGGRRRCRGARRGDDGRVRRPRERALRRRARARHGGGRGDRRTRRSRRRDARRRGARGRRPRHRPRRLPQRARRRRRPRRASRAALDPHAPGRRRRGVRARPARRPARAPRPSRAERLPGQPSRPRHRADARRGSSRSSCACRATASCSAFAATPGCGPAIAWPWSRTRRRADAVAGTSAPARLPRAGRRYTPRPRAPRPRPSPA